MSPSGHHRGQLSQVGRQLTFCSTAYRLRGTKFNNRLYPLSQELRSHGLIQAACGGAQTSVAVVIVCRTLECDTVVRGNFGAETTSNTPTLSPLAPTPVRQQLGSVVLAG